MGPIGGILMLLGAGAAFGLAQDGRRVYEVASVKLNTSGSGSSSSNGSKGQIIMTNLTLKRLVERAYGVKPFQVRGPAWMEAVRVDVAAKYPADTQEDDRMLMLRSLLEDRFKLAVHLKSEDLPGYALVVAKRGFKLKPVQAGGSSTSTNGSRVLTLTAKKVSMKTLADRIARSLEETVIDKTGIDGVYDFELRWTEDDQNLSGADTDAPTLFTALQETLGLRLQAGKVPVDVIVIDHLERVPVEN